MTWLTVLESPLLLLAAGAYLIASLLFLTQLFLWPRADSGEPRRFPVEPHTAARVLLWFGAACHFVSLVGQGSELFTFRGGLVGAFAFALALSFAVFGGRLGDGGGAVVAPVALCGTLYSFAVPEIHTWSPSGRLDAFWLASHVGIILASYVALAFAFAASLLYLAQDGLLKRRKLTGLWQKLPSLSAADEWSRRASAFGLALLSIGLVTGVAFGAVQEPNYSPWRDPKVLFSLVTWAIFALYLAARLRLGWHGRRSNLVVVTGFVVMVVSFFGVPHFVGP